MAFQNNAPHSSRKHIFDFQHFSCRCKCPQFMFCCHHHRSLSSCFDRHTGLSEFALSLVNCAQLSSWARTADTRMCFLCINSSPKHSRASQRGPNPAKSTPDSAKSSPDQAKTISDQKQNQPKSSQELLKSANIKPIQTFIINWPIWLSIPFLPVTSTRLRIRNSRS